jgi:hypothetical protein
VVLYGAPRRPYRGARMSVAMDKPHSTGQAGQTPAAVAVGIGFFAAYHLALAVFMAVAPHAFYTAVGPFGAYNDHYIRDVATYNAAIALALGVALVRPSWRVPVLTLVTLQFALHSLNHLLDVDRAHPAWTGWFDFISLTASTLLLAWILRAAAASRPSGAAPPPEGDPR